MKRFLVGYTARVALAALALAVLPGAGTALAQKNAANGASSNSVGTQKSLETSKRIKFKDKTTVDFDAANIEGTAKSPFGSIVNSRDQDFNKGFIKLRYHWHDQMVMSLSGLSGN